jgi:hypothetical protein
MRGVDTSWTIVGSAKMKIGDSAEREERGNKEAPKKKSSRKQRDRRYNKGKGESVIQEAKESTPPDWR